MKKGSLEAVQQHSEYDPTYSDLPAPAPAPDPSPNPPSSDSSSLSAPPIGKELTYICKSPRAKALWSRAVFKLKSQRAVKALNEEILLYGTSSQLTDHNNQYRRNIDQLIEQKRAHQDAFRRFDTDSTSEAKQLKGLIHPNSPFKLFWNPLISLTLLYTASVMPFRVGFADEVYWDFFAVLDLTIDGVFGVDIVVTFVSASVKADGTLEKDRARIAKSYLKGWFLIDLLAFVPFDLINYALGTKSDESSLNYNNLARLLRLPRLYKLLRIFRIIKALRAYGNSGVIEKLQDLLHLNSRLFKLFKFLMYVLVTVHIMACFWHFSAKIVNFDIDTWVVRYELQDKTDTQRYLVAFYWTVTTVVTVGYGDIVAVTQLEKFLAMVWMIVGGGFYSYTAGSMSSFLTSIDTRDTILAQKIATVQELAQQASLSHEITLKVRDAIRYNTLKTGNIWSDKHSLFSELPKNLRYEVATTMYGGVVKDIYIFRQKEKAFVNYIMPLLRPMHVYETQFLYKQGEYPDEVFFITFGRVDFVIMPREIVFKTYYKGSYVGEVEIIRDISRLNTAVVVNLSELLVLSKSDFHTVMEEFPNERVEMTRVANQRIRKDKLAYLETFELLKFKEIHGDLKGLIGKARAVAVQDTDPSEENDSEAEEDERLSELVAEAREMRAIMQQIQLFAQEVETLATHRFGKTEPSILLAQAQLDL